MKTRLLISAVLFVLGCGGFAFGFSPLFCLPVLAAPMLLRGFIQPKFPNEVASSFSPAVQLTVKLLAVAATAGYIWYFQNKFVRVFSCLAILICMAICFLSDWRYADQIQKKDGTVQPDA
jgi:hypothetical protein